MEHYFDIPSTHLLLLVMIKSMINDPYRKGYEKCRPDKKLNNTPIVKKRQAGASEISFCYLPLLRDLLHKNIILETTLTYHQQQLILFANSMSLKSQTMLLTVVD